MKEKIKNISFDKVKNIFTMNWATGSSLFALLVVCAWFYVNNQNLKSTIQDDKKTISNLSSAVNTLTVKVSNLEGANQTYNNVLKTFIDNPPGVLSLRIDNLEQKINLYLGNVRISNVGNKSMFKNAVPKIK